MRCCIDFPAGWQHFGNKGRNRMPKVEIYTTPFCPYCSRAKALLETKGVAFEEHDVSMDYAERMKMRDRANGGYTVPQIFIAGQHIGGCDDMFALDRAGKLDPLLEV
jgi:glutaredoxin 3